jgi:hypothetical protein
MRINAEQEATASRPSQKPQYFDISDWARGGSMKDI